MSGLFCACSYFVTALILISTPKTEEAQFRHFPTCKFEKAFLDQGFPHAY